MFGSAPQGHFLRGASQGGKQADDQQISADFDTLVWLGSLIAFLWSADEYLRFYDGKWMVKALPCPGVLSTVTFP